MKKTEAKNRDKEAKARGRGHAREDRFKSGIGGFSRLSSRLPRMKEEI